MEFAGIILLAAAGTFYVLVNAGLAIGLRKGRTRSSNHKPFVSVIIAARNEERTLPPLLRSLSSQTYPNFDVFVVDDRSTDRTAEVIAEAVSADPRIRLLRVTEPSADMPAKKNALRMGIASSSGEILCFTDADCLPGPEWIATLVREFDERTGIVAGFSPYALRPDMMPGMIRNEPRALLRLLYRFISYEEFRGGIWAGGSIGWNVGWLCTGRNLAYRREVFDEVGGFEAIKMSVSGDDDLFMQEVRHRTSWRIQYSYAPANQVLTWPPRSFHAFVEQRKRHFSAGKFFTVPMKTFFFAYHLANTVLLGVILIALTGRVPISWALTAFLAKFSADAWMIAAGQRALVQRGRLIEFVPMEVLYAAYNILVGPLGFLASFRWKTPS